jgi:hypothetical protein
MRRVIPFILALGLLVPATASAKFSAARVCGPDDCRTVTFDDGRTLLGMEEPIIKRTGRVASAAPRGPWYRVTLCPERCGASEAVSLRVFPAAGYVQLGHGGWFSLGDDALNAYRTATRGLIPYEPHATSSSTSGSGSGMSAWAWIAIAAVALGAVGLSIFLVRRVFRPHPSR